MVEKKQINFPRYEHYKDSGIEWIGEIPAHWGIIKLKRLILVHSGNGFPVELQGNKKGDLPFLKVSDISLSSKFIISSENYVSFKMMRDKNWNVVPENSIVTAKIGEALRKNHRKILGVDAIVDNNCIGIESLNIHPIFNYYLHQIIDFSWFVNPGAIPNISISKYKNFFVALPSVKEQTAIAQFLDHKTAQIDRAIAIKEAQIKLLNERKQIMIQEAVTKGLDPSVPMKDSGIEWIGEIPAHWEVKKIKYLGNIISGVAIPSELFTTNPDSAVRVIKITNIQTMYMDWKDESYIDKNYFFKYKQFKVQKGDLVFALTRPIISTGIKAAIVKESNTYLLNQRNAVFKPFNGKNISWFYYIFLNYKFIKKFESLIDTTGQQPNISPIDVGNIYIIFPPDKEKDQIVHFLNEKIERVSKLVLSIKSQIQTLKEYKTTLINEAVTGKIKVY